MQIAQPVESLERERQAGQQPDDEQAALVVVADVLQSITILSIVEAFIFNVPSTLGHFCSAEQKWPFVAILVMWRRPRSAASGLSAPRLFPNISCFGLLYSRDGCSISNCGGRK